jgi:hypothetical protein
MKDTFNERAVEFAQSLGFSAELSADVSKLIDYFDVESMSPEEQAVFILEVGRLVHDRYALVINQTRESGGGEVMPYADFARGVFAELIAEGGR